MMEEFSYTLLADWTRPPLPPPRGGVEAGACGPLSALEPHQKLLLLSDGSLTVELELLYGGRVEAEVIHHGYTTLSPEEADLLLEDQENESVERLVWLTVGGRRLVYARTLIPLGCLDGSLREELARRSGEPLGRVLNSIKIPFGKEGLEIGVIRCEAAASGFEAAPSTPLVARRYLLSNIGFDDRRVIKALVTEFFSPEALPAWSTGDARL